MSEHITLLYSPPALSMMTPLLRDVDVQETGETHMYTHTHSVYNEV